MRASRTVQSFRARRIVAALALLAVSLTAVAITAGPSNDPAVHSVRLIIDYNDGVQKHFTAIRWRKDMTVLDAMTHAKSTPHGITFDYKGSGDTALLTRLDDLKNQGGGADKKNWLYWVNTDFADKSFGIQTLEPSDVVLWKYDTWKNQ